MEGNQRNCPPVTQTNSINQNKNTEPKSET